MAFQAVPNVAQFQLMGRVDNCLTINDLYFEISGGGITSINLAEMCGLLLTWFGTNIANLLSDDWSTERVVGIDLTTATGPRREAFGAFAGGVSGEANPNNVAAVVSLRTDQRGRSARGRNYVPGIPGSVVTLNTVEPDY